MDLRPYIEKFSRRCSEVEASLSDPKVLANPVKLQELSREYSRLKDLNDAGARYLKVAGTSIDTRIACGSGTAGSSRLP